MQKAAEEAGIEAEIFAVPASEAEDCANRQKIDVALLGPQVRFMEADFKKKMEPERDSGRRYSDGGLRNDERRKGIGVCAWAAERIRGWTRKIQRRS